MGIFDFIPDGIKNHFNKNKEQREMMEQLQREADAQRLLTFQEEFAKNAKEVAIAQAKKDAEELSGLRKLRATSRVRDLSHNENAPGTFFDKLSTWTQKNKARMHENLARTAEVRKVAEDERKMNLQKRTAQREARTNRSGLGASSWKP